MLYRDGEKLPIIPHQYGYFGVFQKNDSAEILLEESFHYYNEELGSKPNTEDFDCWESVSVYFDLYIKSSEKAEINDFKFEFGKLEKPYRGSNKYINIYSGEVCFATCYYNNYVTISRAWFENYFKTNLIYGDDL